jgi:hypothetical protein
MIKIAVQIEHPNGTIEVLEVDPMRPADTEACVRSIELHANRAVKRAVAAVRAKE